MGMVETSAALGACLLLLTGAIVLDRRPYRPGKPNYVELGPGAASHQSDIEHVIPPTFALDEIVAEL